VNNVIVLLHCKGIERFLFKMAVPQYRAQEWQFFLDTSKRYLKCVLLHNGNRYMHLYQLAILQN